MAPKSSSYQISALPVTVMAHLLVVAIFTLVLVWLLHFRHGLAFKSDNKQKIFNIHPLLMVSFILLMGEAVMAYKSVLATRKIQKIVHLVLHLLALVAGVLGVYAVFKFHHEIRAPDMYTLHSWLGISTIALFGLQWLLGFFSFVFPGAQSFRRAGYLPWHIFGGMVIFFMAILTAETGLVQRFIFLGLRRSQEALIVNFTGLLILLFAIAVGLTGVLPRAY
ncbi:probable ascorbate-specific transmembrane electron transporter 1 [Tripterygium wilfordii]|uniref:probable ascorbate-specific transmembrane electron transporter 1 n=1 Tax=Tripterygium wilfordii TaxID=458696 RepID=UPI0018F83A4D|nr:probable ascorbate-specific transmembrane electron transporter 1 [Tripterygium wilfordii]